MPRPAPVSLRLTPRVSRRAGLRALALASFAALAGPVGCGSGDNPTGSKPAGTTAASSGLPGRVHVSASTKQALGNRFRFESRGPLEVKGKGIIDTFFLY